MFPECTKAITLKDTRKLYKLIIDVIFAPSFIGLTIVLSIITWVNHLCHDLIRKSFTAIGYVLRKVEGIKRLISLPLLVVILVPVVFGLYIVVIILRIVIEIALILYNLHFIILTLPNINNVSNNMEQLVRKSQKEDEF